MADDRVYRRRSYGFPAVLILLGVLFLLGNLQVVSWSRLGYYFARYWPVLLILWGVIKLVEYAHARREGVRPAGLGVGGVFLAILIILFGLGASSVRQMDWDALEGGWDGGGNWVLFGGETYRFGSKELLQDFPAGSSLRVVCDYGDIAVNTWSEPRIKVVYSKTIRTESQERANQLDQQTQPTMALNGQVLTLNANTNAGGEGRVRTDLQLYVPKDAAVDLGVRHGDVTVNDRAANVQISNARGNVNVSNITGNLNATLRRGDLRVSQVNGNVNVDGSLNDVAASDIAGTASFSGSYFGDMNLNRIAKGVSFRSSRTTMDTGRLDGDLLMQSDELRARSLGGIRVVTKSKDIRLQEVSGDVHLENRNGDIEIEASGLPLGNIRIDNGKGDVSLTLPATAAFQLEAHAIRGDISSDFGGISVNSGKNESRASGTVGSGGPKLEISNEYGDVRIRKVGPNAAGTT